MNTLKVQAHLNKYKTAYIVGGVSFLAGVTVSTIILKKTDTQIAPKIQQILSYKPHATMEIHIEALGDPGNIIQDLTTGIIYASQGQAARELGVSSSDISKHLSGKTDSVRGHEFTKLGKASVAQS